MVYMDNIGAYLRSSSEYLWQECKDLLFEILIFNLIWGKKIDTGSLMEMERNKNLNRNQITTRAWHVYIKCLVINVLSVQLGWILRWIPSLSFSSNSAE